ncbi:glycosyltransferase family 4 protein [Acinetobacter baumannii]|uniref:glycosyltransferase family 4 protein n=1 Tax=Acinetobacter baumannii TaxID=470 RepID=UPI003AF72A2A
MKKICFLIGNLNSSGGTERVTSLIANKLSEKENYQIVILSLVDGLKPFFPLNTNIDFFSLYKEKISFKKNLFGVIWKIRNFIKFQKIDTLIVVDTISCVFTIPALFGLETKHIAWEHFNFKNDNGVSFRNLGRRWAARYCDYVVTLTNKDITFWLQSLKKVRTKLICIPNPNPYQDMMNQPSLTHKIVLTVGRLTYVKGYDLLLKVWEKVCEEDSEWTLYIVGGGEEEENLKKLASNLNILNRIVFYGIQSDVSTFYKSSSIFCLTSRNEGLPMVLLEAQSYGLPIVSFDCDTGPSDIVTHGVNGYLIPMGNLERMAYFLKKIMQEKENYKSFSEEAIEKSKKFHIENIIEQWCEII